MTLIAPTDIPELVVGAVEDAALAEVLAGNTASLALKALTNAGSAVTSIAVDIYKDPNDSQSVLVTVTSEGITKTTTLLLEGLTGALIGEQITGGLVLLGFGASAPIWTTVALGFAATVTVNYLYSGVQSDVTAFLDKLYSDAGYFFSEKQILTFNDTAGGSYKVLVGSLGDDTATIDDNGTVDINTFIPNINVNVAGLFGSNGNDDLIGNKENNVLAGDNGNDTLTGNDGDDFLYGNKDNDKLIGGNGVDYIDGGTSFVGIDGITLGDTASYEYVADNKEVKFTYDDNGNQSIETGTEVNGVSANLSSPTPAALVHLATNNDFGWKQDLDTLVNIENIIGSQYNDYIVGDAKNNILYGDVNAAIAGSTGGGKDYLAGGAGADTLFGGGDDDVLNSGSGKDEIHGGTGNDTLLYLPNVSIKNITFSNIAETNGIVTLQDNTVQKFFSIEKIKNGEDTISGGAGNDNILELSKDYVTLSGNFIEVDTGIGNDTVVVTYVNFGDLILDGGDDVDTLDYSEYTTSDFVNIQLGSGNMYLNVSFNGIETGVPTETFDNFENVVGSKNGDVITGSNVANVLTGGSGADTLEGWQGADTFVYSAGDSGVGGGSRDVITDFAAGAEADKIDLSSFADAEFIGNEEFTGKMNEVRFEYDTANDITIIRINRDVDSSAEIEIELTGNVTLSASDFIGLSGSVSAGGQIVGTFDSDSLVGGSGSDFIIGLDGSDILYGRGGSDIISAGSGFDVIYGGAGNDSIFGDANDDTLYGGSGSDLIDGGTGNDVIYGGSGSDTISGGFFDSDRIILQQNAGEFTLISGLDSGDRIDLSDVSFVGINSFADLNLTFNTDGAALPDGTFLTFSWYEGTLGNGNAIRIDVVDQIVTANNFIFGDGGFSGTGLPETYNIDGYLYNSGVVITFGGGFDVLRFVGTIVEASDFEQTTGVDRLEFVSDDVHILELSDDVVATSDNRHLEVDFSGAVSSEYGAFLDGSQVVSGTLDVIGGGGNDTLEGGSLGDIFAGGGGGDTFIFKHNADINSGVEDVITNFIIGEDIIDLTHHSFNYLGSYLDLVILQDGADAIIDLDNNHTIRLTGVDSALLSVDDFTGVTLPIPTIGDDFLIGTNGHDTINGLGGNDTILGLEGDDEIHGGTGNDVLIGGTGNNDYYGGTGIDTYVIEDNLFGFDAIFDFTIDEKIDLSHSSLSHITSLSDIVMRDEFIEDFGDVVWVDLGSGETLAVVGFQSTDLTSANFIFEDGGTTTPPTNIAPQLIAPITDFAIDEDAVFALDVSSNFDDADAGDVLEYFATLAGGSLLPTWLSFDAATGVFGGTPDNGDVSSFDVVVTANDGVEGNIPATDIFTVTVNNVNDAPALAVQLADQSTLEDTAFSFTIPTNTFADIDSIHGDILAYSATLAGGTVLPSWLTFDAATMTFSGIPDNDEVGTISVRVIATDLAGATAEDVFELEVINVSDGQIINGTSGDDFLIGTAGNDTISGLNGDDTLEGGAGDDIIIAGEGSDQMFGGEGSDIFVIEENTNPTLAFSSIFDFTLDEKIDLTAISNITSFSDLNITYMQFPIVGGGFSFMDLGNNNLISILDIQSNQLTEDNFIF